MGVYLSEINMPKDEGSKLVLQIFPNGEVYDEHGIRLGIANWAEAVPVPPHGELIERDKLREKEFIHDGDAYAVVMSRDVRNAPTIIPAELPREKYDNTRRT